MALTVVVLAAGCSSAETDAPTMVPTRSRVETPTASSGQDGATPSSAPESSSPDGAEMPAAEGGAPSSTPTGLPGLSPARQDASLIGRAFPRNASARGRLVAGFPELLRPLRGSLIATSSVATDEQRLQAALVSTTADSPEQVLRGYRVRLSARGMQEQAAPAAAGSVAAAFVRGPSTITVTVTREGAWTSYSVYGALQAGKA